MSELPKNLKIALGLAILGVVGVAAAAFRLSFIALREVAEDSTLKFGGPGNAWLLPIIVDAALVVSEVILLTASMVRVRNTRGLEQYDRTIPFLLVMIFGGVTIYFNVTRVPADVRAVAVLPPAASILMTLALAYLLKMLARVSGTEYIYEAPAVLEPRVLIPRRDTIEGEIIRPDTPPAEVMGMGSAGQAEIETPSGPGSANGHNGHDGTRALGVYGAKRLQVEAYLTEHGPSALQATAREHAQRLRERGVNVSERYVKDIMERLRGSRRR